MSKRQQVRDKRVKETRRKRIVIASIISGAGLIIAAILMASTLKPVGDIIPLPDRARPESTDLTLGNPSAPVTVEIFSDFQCSACDNYWTQLEPSIIENYVIPGKVYYKYNTFNFIGDESFKAAEAAYCAADQGRFWDYHDLVFANWNGENVGTFTDKRLSAFAESINLDMSAFNQCFDNRQYKQKVLSDNVFAQSQGVSATPTFLVNGKSVYSNELVSAIDQALTESGN